MSRPCCNVRSLKQVLTSDKTKELISFSLSRCHNGKISKTYSTAAGERAVSVKLNLKPLCAFLSSPFCLFCQCSVSPLSHICSLKIKSILFCLCRCNQDERRLLDLGLLQSWEKKKKAVCSLLEAVVWRTSQSLPKSLQTNACSWNAAVSLPCSLAGRWQQGDLYRFLFTAECLTSLL